MAKTKLDQLGWGVSPDVGKTAAEGQAAGEAANAALNAGLREQSNAERPGDGRATPENPYVPYSDLDSDKVVSKLDKRPGRQPGFEEIGRSVAIRIDHLDPWVGEPHASGCGRHDSREIEGSVAAIPPVANRSIHLEDIRKSLAEEVYKIRAGIGQ